MADTRKPWLATSYSDMMRHIYAKPKGHSEGLKPYMSETFANMEYPQLNKYSGGTDTGDPIPGDPIPGIPGIPGDPIPHRVQLSCLQQNSLCYCIQCESIGSQIDAPCDEPMTQECQDLVCENPFEPCPPFVLTGNEAEATAPVTLCPSPVICAASVSGGTVVGNCVYVPDIGCGVKTVTVTDICGNKQSKDVRMSNGVWAETSNICHSGCGHDCTTYCQTTSSCYIVSGGTRTYYEYCNMSGQPCDGVNGPCCVSSVKCPGTEGYTLGCDPTYPTGGQACFHTRRTRTYEWVCP